MVEYAAVVYVFAGIALLSALLVPRYFEYQPLSMPMVYVGTGLVLFSLPAADVVPSPHQHPVVIEHLAELVVIVSLMGAGLKLDRPFDVRGWRLTWRLLGVTMPVTAVATALLGWAVLGMLPATAILLGAVIAPTDPVLASDVQAEEPLAGLGDEDGRARGDTEEAADGRAGDGAGSTDDGGATEPDEGRAGAGGTGDVRFALTSEAGLNDGLAFPVTNLAIAAAAASGGSIAWIGEWALVDVGYRIGAGAVVGYLVGAVLARLVFRSLSSSRLSVAITGAEALAATFVAYGLAEAVGGYGFIAVFVAALTLRHFEWTHEYYRTLDEFAGLVEHLLMGAVLVLFGGAIATGLLAPLTLEEAVVGLALVLVVRPASGLLGLVGASITWIERLVVAGFGIRGIGSFYYLAHALNEVGPEEWELAIAREELWAIVGFFVLVSIVLHGLASTPVMRTLDRLREREALEAADETLREGVADSEG